MKIIERVNLADAIIRTIASVFMLGFFVVAFVKSFRMFEPTRPDDYDLPGDEWKRGGGRYDPGRN